MFTSKLQSAFALPTLAAYFYSISEKPGSKEHHLKWMVLHLSNNMALYTNTGRRITIHRFPPIPLEKIRVDSEHLVASIKMQWSLWLSNTMGGNTLEIPLMWYGNLTTMCIRQGKEDSSTLKAANVKQTVQRGVDALGSTALAGQDVYTNPVCVKIHKALGTTVLALIRTPHQVLNAYLYK